MASLQTKVRMFLLLISLSILGALLYFSDIGKVAGVITQANPVYVLLVFFLSIFLMLVRTFRWRILLEKIDVRVPFARLFPSYMAGMFISNITPGKIGEPIKSYILKKTAGVSISRTLSSVFMERIFDVFCAIILSIGGVLLVSLPVNIEIVLLCVAAFYLIGITGFIYVSAEKGRIHCVSKKLLKLFGWLRLARKMEAKAENFAVRFNETLAGYKDSRVLSKVFLISLFVWLMEGMIAYLCFLSVGLQVDVFVTIAFLSIAVLIGVTSFLPGGIGSIEVVLVLLFTTAYPFPVYSVTAAVLISRFLSLWVNVFTGAACMSSLKLDLK